MRAKDLYKPRTGVALMQYPKVRAPNSEARAPLEGLLK